MLTYYLILALTLFIYGYSDELTDNKCLQIVVAFIHFSVYLFISFYSTIFSYLSFFYRLQFSFPLTIFLNFILYIYFNIAELYLLLVTLLFAINIIYFLVFMVRKKPLGNIKNIRLIKIEFKILILIVQVIIIYMLNNEMEISSHVQCLLMIFLSNIAYLIKKLWIKRIKNAKK